MSEKTGIIIQARTDSTRFPRKVLYPLPITSDIPMIQRIVDIGKSIKNVDEIIVATTTDDSDDELYSYCISNNIHCFRGSVDNVLNRFIKISKEFKLQHIVRLTGDNPIQDAFAISKCIENHKKSELDYTYTEGLPTGMNIEIVTRKALESVQALEITKEDREHVTLKIKNDDYFNKNKIVFKLGDLCLLRLTVDYVSDYLLMNTLFCLLDDQVMSLEFIEKMYGERGWLFEGNSHNYQKKQFKSFEDEKEEALKILKKFELYRIAKLLRLINE